MKKRIVILMMLICSCFNISVFENTVNAENNKYASVKQQSFTVEEIAKVTPYITLKNGRFELSKNQQLNPILKRKVIKQLNITNDSIQSYGKSVYYDSLNKKVKTTTLLERSSGKNGLEWNWNYVRVYIDAPTLRTAVQLGASIGPIHVPSRLAQYALALLGVVPNYIEHGIWFDVNYAYMVPGYGLLLGMIFSGGFNGGLQ